MLCNVKMGCKLHPHKLFAFRLMCDLWRCFSLPIKLIIHQLAIEVLFLTNTQLIIHKQVIHYTWACLGRFLEDRAKNCSFSLLLLGVSRVCLTKTCNQFFGCVSCQLKCLLDFYGFNSNLFIIFTSYFRSAQP